MKNLFSAAMLGSVLLGCSNDSPTRPNPVSEPALLEPFDAVAPTAELDAAAYMGRLEALFHDMQRMPQRRQLSAAEDFSCVDVEEVRARFSDPGFVLGPNVGLFVKFVGMPAGEKTLRVWWDHENAFHVYEDIHIGDGEVNPDDPSRFDIEMVIEHHYDIGAVEAKRVRVELILSGETGNCARNRDVIVTPDPVAGGGGGGSVPIDHLVTFDSMPACNSFPGFFRSMGILVNVTPGIPAGTSYTVQIRVSATGVVGSPTTQVIVGNTVGPDFTSASASSPPPNDFTMSLTSTVLHDQLSIPAQIFGGSTTSMSVQVLGVSVPGKNVVLGGTIIGTCSI